MELFTDPDELHYLTCGEEVVGLDLDKVYHQYEFARHDFIKGEAVRQVGYQVFAMGLWKLNKP